MTEQEIFEAAQGLCGRDGDSKTEFYFSKLELIDFARALLSKAIPEGYVVVPKELTSREMNKYELFSEDEFIALVRMNECFMDGEGYDVEPEMVDKLIEIGLIYRPRRNLCALTDYGVAVLKENGKK